VSSSLTFRLTVASGTPRSRLAAEKLPLSTTLRRIVMASRRSTIIPWGENCIPNNSWLSFLTEQTMSLPVRAEAPFWKGETHGPSCHPHPRRCPRGLEADLGCRAQAARCCPEHVPPDRPKSGRAAGLHRQQRRADQDARRQDPRADRTGRRAGGRLRL